MKYYRSILRHVGFLTLLGLVAAMFVAQGQTITGSMSGRVTDQQGGGVPNATVTATEATKRVTVTAKSGAAGDFLLPALLPGNYQLSAEATGFKKLTRNDVALNANDKL